MLADMPELLQLEPKKQVASSAGIAPVARQSGTWRGRSFIRGGRAHMREALYMPALVALRFNPPLKAKYQTLIDAGKLAKVAITAITRKLLILPQRTAARWANLDAEDRLINPDTLADLLQPQIVELRLR